MISTDIHYKKIITLIYVEFTIYYFNWYSHFDILSIRMDMKT